MLRRILYLNEGDLARLLPFFFLYLLLFSAFSLLDGLSQALFVQRVGPERLPLVYGAVAAANLVVMGLYILLAEKMGAIPTFVLILLGSVLVFGITWVFLSGLGGGGYWYGVLYAGREIVFTLMLMHFGTFLNDFFSRLELNRVLPLIYSGGRVGGILGGFLLQHLSAAWGLVNLLGIFLLLCLAGLGLVLLLARLLPHVTHPEDHSSDVGIKSRGGPELEVQARASFRGFLYFVWASPLLFWITATSVLFILCRWILNFQYSGFFAEHFEDDRAMAEFLGLYTQLALVGSLVIQVLIVSRLVAWVGLKGANLVYGLLLVLSMAFCLGEMTLGLAVFARLMETELRFGLRNPIMQLITNKFSKGLRVRVRAWSLGMVIPLATLLTSVLLGVMVEWGQMAWIPWLGAGCGLLYMVGSLGLVNSFSERPAVAKPEEPMAFPSDGSILAEGKAGGPSSSPKP